MAATTATARYREVLRVLVRYGFGFIVGGRFPFSRRQSEADVAEALSRPSRLRAALEELGTTFIKIGQILSTRPDLLPPEYIAELQKLQDAVPAAPTALIIARIETELGAPVATLFEAFDPTPIASASIGQVHAVTLPGGIDAVVKVQRPGVRDRVQIDLEIAARIARLAEERLNVQERTGINLPALVDEFGWTLRNELDYIREAKNAEIFQRNFAATSFVYIPAICWEYTTAQIITMERLRGLRIDDVAGLAVAGYPPAQIAQQSAEIVMQEVFEDGFFHADLHPGNLFVLPGGVIGAIDFGMVGTIDENTRAQLLLLLVAIVGQDADRITDHLYRLGVVGSARTDRVQLRRDVQRLMAQYYGLTLAELDASLLVADLLALVRRHHLTLPADLALLMKMLLMIEGLGRTLDPAFNVLAVAQPYGKAAIGRLIAPKRVAGQARQAAIDMAWLSLELPGRLDRLLRQLEQGKLVVQSAAVEAEKETRIIQSIANRLAFGILIGSFIIGLALVILAIQPSGNDLWVQLLIVAGFGVVSLLGLLFVWSLWRSGRS
jgi:ubiquinone biosynthesis protein